MNEYNTSKQFLILKEYGRNVQKLVEFVITVEDKEKRNNYARTLIELMRQINPAIRDSHEYSQKLWDDLYIMSQFKLDVDCPFPLPEKSLLGRKPKPLIYNQNKIKYKHYGRNVELMIQKAVELEDPEDKEAAIYHIGKLMKSFYSTWNKENIDDSVIAEHIRELSNYKLEVDLDKIRSEGRFDSLKEPRERSERIERSGDKERGDRKVFIKKTKRPETLVNKRRKM